MILRACSCGQSHPQGQRCPNYRKPSGRRGSTRYYREQRAAALHRDGFACTVCGATTGLEAHHVIPWAKGGSDHASTSRLAASLTTRGGWFRRDGCLDTPAHLFARKTAGALCPVKRAEIRSNTAVQAVLGATARGAARRPRGEKGPVSHLGPPFRPLRSEFRPPLGEFRPLRSEFRPRSLSRSRAEKRRRRSSAGRSRTG